MSIGTTTGRRPAAAAVHAVAPLLAWGTASTGQNVAFVPSLAGPLLRRLGQRQWWAAAVAVVAFFALLIRWEPSLLRASALAVLALTVCTIGRSASRVRLLALAVTALVVLDPFLVRSVAFLLSVCASLGILLLTSLLSARPPGRRRVADRWPSPSPPGRRGPGADPGVRRGCRSRRSPPTSSPCRPPGPSWCGASPAAWSPGWSRRPSPPSCTVRPRRVVHALT